MINEKIERIKENLMTCINVKILKKAVDVLSICRRTLAFTYAFAFYLKPDNNVYIFEDNQRDLEMATESLSELLERDLEDEDWSKLKEKIRDKYCYVERRLKVLLDHCSELTELDLWIFND